MKELKPKENDKLNSSFSPNPPEAGFFSGGFFMFPKCLLTNEAFSGLSLQAKVLFALILDRLCLSEKNGWRDASGVFIYFKLSEIARYLGCSAPSAAKYLKELTKSGLITRKRQGLCKPDVIYPAFEMHDALPQEASSVSSKQALKPEGLAKQSFAAPAPQEITAYINENSLNVKPQAFCDYYSSKGWRVGKNKMTDWRAALRRWSMREDEFEKERRRAFRPKRGDITVLEDEPNYSIADLEKALFGTG